MTIFRALFAPTIEAQQLAREFQVLRQVTETMAKITTKFKERDLLVLQYVVEEEMNKTRYHDMLMDGIIVSMSGCRTLDGMIDNAREREINLELRTKQKPTQVQEAEGPKKRPKTFDLRSIG